MCAVTADKAKDGHTNQFTVCVIFQNIKERFFCLEKLDCCGADAITKAVEQV